MYFCNLRPFYPFLFFPFIHSFNLFVHASYVKRDASMQDWLRSTTKLITNLFPYNSFLSTLTRTSLKNFQKARLSYKSNKFYKSFRVVYNRSKYIFEQKLLYFLVHHFDEICIVNSNSILFNSSSKNNLLSSESTFDSNTYYRPSISKDTYLLINVFNSRYISSGYFLLESRFARAAVTSTVYATWLQLY